MLLHLAIAHQQVATPYSAPLPAQAVAVVERLRNLPILQKATVGMAVLAAVLLVIFLQVQMVLAVLETPQAPRRRKVVMAAMEMFNPHIKLKAAVAAQAR